MKGDTLVPWDFTLEGNVIVKEEEVAGGYATPQEEAELPPTTQLQLADFRSRGIRYVIKDGRPHIVSVPVIETDMNKFFSAHEPCFFEGCEQLRQQWEQFKVAAEEEDPGCDVSCAKGKIKRQFMERLRPILHKHHADATTPSKTPASTS